MKLALLFLSLASGPQHATAQNQPVFQRMAGIISGNKQENSLWKDIPGVKIPLAGFGAGNSSGNMQEDTLLKDFSATSPVDDNRQAANYTAALTLGSPLDA